MMIWFHLGVVVEMIETPLAFWFKAKLLAYAQKSIKQQQAAYMLDDNPGR